VLTYFLLPDSRALNQETAAASAAQIPFAESVRRAFASRPLAMALLLTFLYTLGVQFFFSQGALFAKVRFGFDEMQTGLLIAYSSVINAVMQAAIIGRVVARIGEQRTVAVGALLLGVGLFGVAAAFSWPWMLAATTVTSVGFALLIASLTSLVTQLAHPSERGMVLGVSTSTTSLANALAPAIGGAMFGALGAGAPMSLGGVLLLVCFAIALGLPSGEASPQRAEAQPAEIGR
jgi:predicted MFS family arabinose efflux permease